MSERVLEDYVADDSEFTEVCRGIQLPLGIVALNIPTAQPLAYELDADLKPIRHYYLGDSNRHQIRHGIGRKSRKVWLRFHS
jgi:hypothetical protein